MKSVIKKFMPYFSVSLFCMFISNVSYAGFFDDLKNQVENAVKETTDDIKGKVDKAAQDKTKELNNQIDTSIKDTPDNVIRGVTGDSNKQKLAKEKALEKLQKQVANKPLKKEAVQVISQPDMAKKEDENATQQNDEDAKWEALVAEEKAKRAKKQLGQAEHELYQEDLNLAVKENEQALERAWKKYAPDRDPYHRSIFSIRYIAHQDADQFIKALNTYKIDGLSLGMKISVLEKTLISRGYKRFKRYIAKDNAYYIYKRRKKNNISTEVEIRAAGFNDVPDRITIRLSPVGKKKIVEEKIRVLKAFSGTCKFDGNVYCYKYTDTNELRINIAGGNYNPKITYIVQNVISKAASLPGAP